MMISEWLNQLGLNRYLEAFEENDIDAETLAMLEDADLRELGVSSLGHRKKILAAIAKLQGSALPPIEPSIVTPAGPETSSPEPRLEGDRRPVTVLFTDICGFTTLSGTLDPEQTVDLLNRYFARVDGIIESFGGRIDKHIGDGVMGVFGAPIAHENDPERAVRAALAIHAAMPDLSRELGRRLEVHIGVASGEVVASRTGSAQHGEYTITGDTVNLSARLEALSGPRETLISQRVVRATQGLFALESAGSAELQGFAEPIEVWRVLGEAHPDGGEPLLFVGREAERRQIDSMLDYVKTRAQPHVAYLRGEAGIGKSALSRTIAADAAALAFECRTVQISDFGDSAHGDILALIARALADRAETDNPVMDDLLGHDLSLEARAALTAMDTDTRVQARRAAVRDLLRRTAEAGPLLLAVEDVHWARRSALDDLTAVVSELPALPFALLITSRIEGDPTTTSTLRNFGTTPMTTIDLRPLSSDEAREMAAHTLNVSREMADKFIERAEGNPLFLEQMLREVDVMADDGLPTSIQSLVLSRLDRLPTSDRAALQGAAILGQRLDLAALRHVIEQPDYQPDTLERHYLMRPEGEQFRFEHALIRDSVYSSLLGPTRRALHERAAEWFRESDPSLHALHLDRAGSPLAPAAYCRAGQMDINRTQYVTARNNFERGLELAQSDQDCHDLSLALGDLSIWQGDAETAERLFHQAHHHAADDAARCRALVGLAGVARNTGDIEAGRTTLSTALSLAEIGGLTRELARIHHLLGTFHFVTGAFEDCLSEQRLALEHARAAGDAELEAQCLGGLGDAQYAGGFMRSALESLTACVELAHANGFGRIEVAHRFIRGNVLRYQNQLSLAIEEVGWTIEMSERTASRRTLMVASLILGEFHMDRDELDMARAPLERGYQIARDFGNENLSTYTSMHLLRHAYLSGDAERLATAVDTALAHYANTRPSFIGPRLWANIALTAKSEADRKRSLARGFEALQEGALAHNHFWYRRDAMESALAVGAWDEARAHADTLETYTVREPLPWTDLVIERARLLADLGERPNDTATRGALTTLRQRIEEIGWRVLLRGMPKD